MNGYKSEIETASIENKNFREVLYTSEHSQLVLMSLLPGEDIGMETHPDNDQFIRIEKGFGKSLIDGHEYGLQSGDAIVIPSGSKHNIINLSDAEDLKLYTIYSPPHHQDGIVRATKADAESIPEEFDGKTSEGFAAHTNGNGHNGHKEMKLTLAYRTEALKSKKHARKLAKYLHRIALHETQIDELKEKIAALGETAPAA